MRILHLINALDRGGIEMWLVSLLKKIPHNQYIMDVCCRGASIGEMADDVIALGVTVYHVPFGAFHVGFYRGLKQVLIEGKYDILHNHMETYSGFSTWIANHVKVPVITSYHNTHTPPQTSLTRQLGIRQLRALYGKVSIDYAIQHSDYLTACSQSVLDSFNITDHPRAEVLYYGIDIPQKIDSNARSELRLSFGWQPSDPMLIHVGRFYEQKNHTGLLQIFEHVRKQIPNVRLLLVGDGMLRPQIEASIHSKNLTDVVHFSGMRDDVSDLLQCADLFVMPSLYEGFGLAALEASAAGLPVIGSLTTGLIEAVEDNNTGYLFPIDDIEGMATACIELLNHPAKRLKIGQHGKARAEVQFGWDVCISKLERLYDACYRGS
ncbi:MAG: glycosyltransferase [Chloroflexota bacterium]